MPCHIVKTDPLFAHLKPVIHSFCVHELLGHAEKENPGTFGIWSIDAGNAVTCKSFTVHCFVTVTEGEFWVEDQAEQGKRVNICAGDIFHVPVGASLKWGTSTGCKGIYVHLKALGDPIFVNSLE